MILACFICILIISNTAENDLVGLQHCRKRKNGTADMEKETDTKNEEIRYLHLDYQV